MKSLRERYFEDYTAEMVDADNRKGYKIVYTYTGNWYSWDVDGPDLLRRRSIYAALALAATMLFILCGTRPAFINTAGIVVIPCVVSVVTQMYEWISIIQFCVSKKMMHEKDCKHIYSFLQATTALTAACHLFSAIAGVCLMIADGMESASVLTVLGLLVCAAISWMLHRYHKQLKYVKVLEPDLMFDEMPFE